MHSPGLRSDPVHDFLKTQRAMILDGGLATELEFRGHDLSDDLWSARLLLEEPEAIREVHLDYLRSGADCLIGASYQATFEGFAKRGLSRRQASELFRRSVDLAREARDQFWAEAANRLDRSRPLVVASVGPYGAFLADGSEFTGDYRGVDDSWLEEFHRPRWEVLSSSAADLVACETIPSRSESRVLRRLLESTKGAFAWFSFCCRDGSSLGEGSPIREVVADLDDCPQIVALGINCTPPQHMGSLVREVRRGTSKPIVVYPNSGEVWDGENRVWVERDSDTLGWIAETPQWIDLGVRMIGGCCRTRPRDINALRATLLA